MSGDAVYYTSYNKSCTDLHSKSNQRSHALSYGCRCTTEREQRDRRKLRKQFELCPVSATCTQGNRKAPDLRTFIDFKQSA